MTTPPETPQRPEQPPEPVVERKARYSETAAHVSSGALASLGARVRRAQQGDLYALDALIRSFQRMAVGYAASQLGDAQRAEDVAQEALVEATYRLSSLHYPEAFPSLLRALIRKHCDRLTRRRTVAVTSLEDASDDAATAKTVRGTDPTMQHVQDAAKREMVRQAVDHLPSSEREVVLLYYMDEQSQQDIADTLGLPVSTVKSRLHEARAHLKRLLWPLSEEGLPVERPWHPHHGRDVVVKKPYLPEPGSKTVVKKKYLKESG